MFAFNMHPQTSTSFIAVNDTEDGASEYPDAISPSTRANISVPMPRERDPDWTSKGNALALPSFASLITLPDPQTHPAYYAAAADTIRMTNWRFKEHGPYTQVLLKKHVTKQAAKWRTQFPDEDAYPFPPDLRTLYVKADDVHPAEDGRALWTQACAEFQDMKDFEKPGFLRKTRAQHIRENELEGRGVEKDEKLYMRIFKRYLAWKEHVEQEDERDDEQPTRGEMQDLFANTEVKKNGITLADVCHAFPDAQDIEMLVLRIERVAVYTAKPDEKGDPVEGVYMPKPAPALYEEQTTQVIADNGQPSGELLIDGEQERQQRAIERMRHMVDQAPLELALLLDDLADWDAAAGRYVKKTPALEPVPPPSPTVGTPASPLGRKRQRAEEDEPALPSKKAKRQQEEEEETVLVRCNGTTRQMKQCKKKHRLPRGETYNCGKHA